MALCMSSVWLELQHVRGRKRDKRLLGDRAVQRCLQQCEEDYYNVLDDAPGSSPQVLRRAHVLYSSLAPLLSCVSSKLRFFSSFFWSFVLVRLISLFLLHVGSLFPHSVRLIDCKFAKRGCRDRETKTHTLLHLHWHACRHAGTDTQNSFGHCLSPSLCPSACEPCDGDTMLPTPSRMFCLNLAF